MRRACRHAALAAALGPLAAVAVVAAGCDSGGELTGSLKETYGITHQSVRVRLTTAELAVEYVGPRGSVPVRATLDLRAAGEPRPGRYELPAFGWIGGRLVNETELPPLVRGEIELDEITPQNGTRVRGSFSGRFDAGRDELGLGGEFDEVLEVVTDLGEPPVAPDPGGAP